MKNAIRIYENLHTTPTYESTLTEDEANYILLNYSGVAVVNGTVRKIKADKLTDKVYKIYTVLN